MTNEAAAFTSTKSYYNYPCAHRQWKSDSACALVHGYSRSFHFVFASQTRDECGFVVDFGGLKWLKQHLDYMFDHTLLLAEDDPLMPQFRELEKLGACAIRTFPHGIGMEGTAQYLCEYVGVRLRSETKGRAWVVSVEARENDKNSAVYHNPDGHFRGWL